MVILLEGTRLQVLPPLVRAEVHDAILHRDGIGNPGQRGQRAACQQTGEGKVAMGPMAHSEEKGQGLHIWTPIPRYCERS